MITVGITTENYDLTVVYETRDDISVSFSRFGGETFNYECSHKYDVTESVSRFSHYFDDAEYERFYQTVLTLIE